MAGGNTKIEEVNNDNDVHDDILIEGGTTTIEEVDN